MPRLSSQPCASPSGAPRSSANKTYVAGLLQFLLWQRGACRVYAGGPAGIGEHLAGLYSTSGDRAFDAAFLGETIYGRPFEVIPCSPEEVPQEAKKPPPWAATWKDAGLALT